MYLYLDTIKVQLRLFKEVPYSDEISFISSEIFDEKADTWTINCVFNTGTSLFVGPINQTGFSKLDRARNANKFLSQEIKKSKMSQPVSDIIYLSNPRKHLIMEIGLLTIINNLFERDFLFDTTNVGVSVQKEKNNAWFLHLCKGDTEDNKTKITVFRKRFPVHCLNGDDIFVRKTEFETAVNKLFYMYATSLV